MSDSYLGSHRIFEEKNETSSYNILLTTTGVLILYGLYLYNCSVRKHIKDTQDMYIWMKELHEKICN